MKRRSLYILLGLSFLFFVISLAIFLKVSGHGRQAALDPEIVDAIEEDLRQPELAVRVFFLNESGLMVPGPTRQLRLREPRLDVMRDFVNLLLRADGLVPVPADTSLRSLFFLPAQEMLVIDFSEGLLHSFPAGTASEREFIYYFVNNICYNFQDVKKVRFLVAGNELSSISGHLDLENPYFPDFNLIRNE